MEDKKEEAGKNSGWSWRRLGDQSTPLIFLFVVVLYYLYAQDFVDWSANFVFYELWWIIIPIVAVWQFVAWRKSVMRGRKMKQEK